MVVTYNRLKLTQKTFDNLFITTDYPFYLIIVDNGSQDGTIQYLEELIKNESKFKNNNLYFQGFITKFNQNNRGIAVGRNQALQLADKLQTEWLSTIDNDIELPQGWLTECIEIIKSNPKFMIGVNMEGVNYPLISINNQTFQIKKAGNLGTACTVFNKNLHELIGFFTTEYEKYGEDDANWGFRARVVKWEMGYIERPGHHLGEGIFDIGEYRQFKDECRKNNLSKFHKDCFDYTSGQKHYYIDFNDIL